MFPHEVFQLLVQTVPDFSGGGCKVQVRGIVHAIHHKHPILDALKYGFIPVIAPLATDFYGQVYNINADMAACDIARSLKARKLVFLSDVPGILRDPSDEKSLISSIRTSEVDKLIAEGVLSGGMLPKIRSSVAALEAGTREVHDRRAGPALPAAGNLHGQRDRNRNRQGLTKRDPARKADRFRRRRMRVMPPLVRKGGSVFRGGDQRCGVSPS